MKSVLQARSGDGKAYNLVLVCSGAIKDVQEAVLHLQKTLRAYVSAQSIRLYDQDTLWKAEAEPNRLSRSAALSFRTAKSYYCKHYQGFLVPCDMDRLYAFLFSSLKNENDSSPCPYYSKKMLLSILNGDFREEETQSPLVSDFEISYRYEILENGSAYAKISCHLNSICAEDPVPHLSWCDSVIEDMDERFSECFFSAYVSYAHPDWAVMHEQLYPRYDASDLNRFLLGAEWSVYASNSVLREAKTDFSLLLAELASVQQLSNGRQWKANIEICRFDNAWRAKLNMALQDLLTPAYGVYSWSIVWTWRKYLLFSPQAVHVFYDPYNADDPMILFSYGMRSEQIRGLQEVHNAEPMDGFYRKTT